MNNQEKKTTEKMKGLLVNIQKSVPCPAAHFFPIHIYMKGFAESQ